MSLSVLHSPYLDVYFVILFQTDLENALKKSKPSVTPGDIQKFDEFAHRVLAHR